MLPLAYLGGYIDDVRGLIIGVSLSGVFTGLIALILMRINLKQLLGDCDERDDCNESQSHKNDESKVEQS